MPEAMSLSRIFWKVLALLASAEHGLFSNFNCQTLSRYQIFIFIASFRYECGEMECDKKNGF